MTLGRTLRLFASIGAIALIGALATPLSASAAPGDDVLVFSNPNVVDTGPSAFGGEYEWISAAITAAGFDVTSFDGGDGSALAWTTALTDIEVFVLPEQENGNFYDPLSPPAWLSEAAKDALVNWIRAGGAMLQSSACNPEQVTVLNEAVGVDYSDVVDCSGDAFAPRWLSDASLPDALRYLSGTNGFDLTAMSESQLAPLTVWYAGSFIDQCTRVLQDTLAVGVFAAGSGRVAFEAWDYFNDTSPGGEVGQADWNAVLASLIDGNGSPSTWVPSDQPEPPAPKAPVTATTAPGEMLITISGSDPCDNVFHQAFRVDPTTALAAPVGDDEIEGAVAQGAWDPISRNAYFPFYNNNVGNAYLMTVDPATGDFAEIGQFDIAQLDDIAEIYSIAIGVDGSAYLMAELQIGGDYYRLALLSLDLTDASLTLIAQIDDSMLDAPNGFAADPSTGLFYAFEEDTRELFQVNVATGALTFLGELDAPSLDSDGFSDVTALQIGADGTFWVVFDEADAVWDEAGMLATFTLADIAGGMVSATEVGLITDDPIESRSLLIVPGAPELAATGANAQGLLAGSALLLLLGGLFVGARTIRRRAQTI